MRVQCRHSHHRPNDIGHVSNNVRFFLNIFELQLVESVDAEPTDMEGHVYMHTMEYDSASERKEVGIGYDMDEP